MGIHNWDKKYHAGIRQVKKAAISGENKEMILDFADELMIEGISKTSQEVRMTAHIKPETWEGSYDTNIEVDLIKYYDEINQEYVSSGGKLKAFPIIINVHKLYE